MDTVSLELSLDAPEDTVWADPAQLVQVFLNILLNALDALTDPPVDHRALVVETENRNRQIRIRITDTGPGMPPDVLDKAFDPFFTTKGVGKGTGLGLSVCYRIVRDAGGSIHIDGRPEQGTTVVVEFPLSPKPPDPTGQERGPS
jgi:two-component system NtrC family sensor kinase